MKSSHLTEFISNRIHIKQNSYQTEFISNRIPPNRIHIKQNPTEQNPTEQKRFLFWDTAGKISAYKLKSPLQKSKMQKKVFTFFCFILIFPLI